MPSARRILLIMTPIAAVLLALGTVTSSIAATASKKSVLSAWTQASSTSVSAWDAARTHQRAWARYRFTWTTDYCSKSPDAPLGFDFRMSCWRHDFGYRNYKAIGAFPANKDRVDRAFQFDLKKRCEKYDDLVRPACLSLAAAYVKAVREFGALNVSEAELSQAATMKASAEAAAARE